jgi:hypothetical protein
MQQIVPPYFEEGGREIEECYASESKFEPIHLLPQKSSEHFREPRGETERIEDE